MNESINNQFDFLLTFVFLHFYRTSHRVPAIKPTKSVVSQASSKPISFASDISGLDDDVNETEMLSKEFYNHVKREREALQASSGKRAFRWTDLKAALENRYPYFKEHSAKQIRNRFKYVKRELRDVLKN